MMKLSVKTMIWFALGMLTFAIGTLIVNSFFLPTRPEKGGIIEDWGEICVWQDVDGIILSISPRGCYSSTCTQIKQQIGTAVVDLQSQEIHLNARFTLLATSRFLLPCAENCSGGGRIQFELSNLLPNVYTIWFSKEKVGEVNIFSGRTTPRQCFDTPQE